MEIKEIKIYSHQGGWGEKEDWFNINKENEGYYAKGKNIIKDIKINEDDIKNLIAAIEEPIIPERNFYKIGITKEWLNENIGSVDFTEPGYRPGVIPYDRKPPTEAQRELFSKTFTNIEIIHELLEKYYKMGWSDDYPDVRVNIIGTKDERIDITSDVQQIFMIPWKIFLDGQLIKTYNNQISKAIAKLLPDGFLNKDRIDGSYLLSTIQGRLIFSSIAAEWNKLEADEVIGKYIAPIKQEYVIKSSQISCLSSIDIEFAEGWHAKLHHKTWPLYVVLWVFIPYENEEMGSVTPILEKSSYYIDLMLSIDWFLDFLNDNPKTKVEIRFVGNISMSKKARETFIENMGRHGKETIINEIEQYKDKICFLEVDNGEETMRGFSRWIILPDKRMVLWHFVGDKVLKWDSTQFETWEVYGFSQVGAIISKDGHLI